MTDSSDRPLLWRVMQRRADAAMAAYHPSVTDEQLLAAEIRAVAEWLYKQGSLADLAARADTIKLLYAKAERAERGE